MPYFKPDFKPYFKPEYKPYFKPDFMPDSKLYFKGTYSQTVRETSRYKLMKT